MRRRDLAVPLCALLLTLMVASLALTLRSSTATSRRALDERFDARAVISVGFVESYVADVLGNEAAQARRRLSAAHVSAAAFDSFTADHGFTAAVLLDGDGSLLHVWPHRPGLVGKNMTAKYAHLAAATAGRPSASIRVPAAATATPVVAFAAPYVTASGQHRVYSGAFSITRTPLAEYLHHITPIGGYEMYLVDTAGSTLSSAGGPSGTNSGEARPVPRALAIAAAHSRSGAYGAGDSRRHFVAADVANAPWRLLVSVPEQRLYAPLRSLSTTPWLVLGALSIAGLVVLVLLVRLRRRADELSLVAHIDPLTGLVNRRNLAHEQVRIDAAAARRQTTTAVLVLDIDHFKQVNDAYGHAIGDDVLRGVARAIQATVRPSDVVARLGGEEFAVVLEDTVVTAACVAAERIRHALLQPILTAAGPITVTVSIGAAAGCGLSALLVAGDEAMYAAKQAGRDRVEVCERPHADSGEALSPV